MSRALIRLRRYYYTNVWPAGPVVRNLALSTAIIILILLDWHAAAAVVTVTLAVDAALSWSWNLASQERQVKEFDALHERWIEAQFAADEETTARQREIEDLEERIAELADRLKTQTPSVAQRWAIVAQHLRTWTGHVIPALHAVSDAVMEDCCNCRKELTGQIYDDSLFMFVSRRAVHRSTARSMSWRVTLLPASSTWHERSGSSKDPAPHPRCRRRGRCRPGPSTTRR